MGKRKDFYVYVHRDKKGEIFYVGKGTGRRAWSQDRHLVWQRYVEKIGGNYDVEIVKQGLNEEDASELEEELIDRYGEQLVNWDNHRRQFDYPAIEQYHQLRDANRAFVQETKAFEKRDLEKAVERYQQAMKRMIEYESMVLERGIVAELSYGWKTGEILILDRLTVCLKRLGRYRELVAEVDRYFENFPPAKDMAAAHPIHKRREEAVPRSSMCC